MKASNPYPWKVTTLPAYLRLTSHTLLLPSYRAASERSSYSCQSLVLCRIYCIARNSLFPLLAIEWKNKGNKLLDHKFDKTFCHQIPCVFLWDVKATFESIDKILIQLSIIIYVFSLVWAVSKDMEPRVPGSIMLNSKWVKIRAGFLKRAACSGKGIGSQEYEIRTGWNWGHRIFSLEKDGNKS